MPTDAPNFPALLERYERPLVRFAWNFLGDLEAARDVAQETFIRLCRWREAADENTFDADHTEAWLFRVARNLCIDYQRRQGRVIYVPEAVERSAEGPVPGDELARREEQDSIFALLDQLSANQREVIRLKFQHDLSYKEIAEKTNLTVTNVGFLLHAGLKKLRGLLEPKPLTEPAETSSNSR